MQKWYRCLRQNVLPHVFLPFVLLTVTCAGAEPPALPVDNAEELDKIFPVGEEIKLFDGKTLNGWHVADKSFFQHHGEVTIQKDGVILKKGNPGTGIAWTKIFPRLNYEIQLEAKRGCGHRFFLWPYVSVCQIVCFPHCWRMGWRSDRFVERR